MCKSEEFVPIDDEQKRQFVREARELRGAVMRDFYHRLIGSFSLGLTNAWTALRVGSKRVTAVARKGWQGYARRLEYRAAVRELSGLDDRSLKDMGLHRSEIESVIYGVDAPREGKVAAYLFHKPPPKPIAGRPAAIRNPIERNAA